MVAIVAGNGLGLFNASNNILGNAGILGDPQLGQARAQIFLNAADGNLVLSSDDEDLSGAGTDLRLLRTYNSAGKLSDGLGTGWSLDGERTVVFGGGANPGSGGTVTRTTGDGHTDVFRWNQASGTYVSDEGSGAQDTLSYNANTRQWTFVDGTTRQTEVYGDSTGPGMVGQLQSETDSSGNTINYSYDASSRLSSITDHGSGQKLVLNYAPVSAGSSVIRLQSVTTFKLASDSKTLIATGTLGPALTQVTYQYDALGRLKSVSTDLTPDNTTDNSVYTTSYTYVNATSNLVASVTQSDGTTVSFTYDASNRVATATTGTGAAASQQAFAYNTAADGTTSTTITDANGQMWTYVYDANSRLTQINAPAPSAGVPAPVTQFQYDDRGNLTQLTQLGDAQSRTTTYQYDARDNRILERDALGDTITRTYDPTTNQLLTETTYTGHFDPSNTSALGQALTTRYLYDSNGRVRFVLSPAGRVTEIRYGGQFNLQTDSITYAGGLYDVSGLSATDLPTLTQLTSWANAEDKTQTQLTHYTYDLRGNLATATRFASVNTDGSGVANDPANTVIQYIYDGYGELLQMIALRGDKRTQQDELTGFAYDGLGRMTSQLNANGTQQTVYDDAHHQIDVLNTDTGLSQISTYDSRGQVLSVVQTAQPDVTDAVTQSESNTRSTQYLYDSLGQLRMVQDAQGNRTFNFYDADGRLSFTVDSTGAVCGYAYNAEGQMTGQTCYATQVLQATLSSWVTNSTVRAAISVGTDVKTSADDRTTTYVYDPAGRLYQAIDAIGTTTTTLYDGDSRVTSQSTGSRVTHYYYDADSNQVGVVDPLGYLTESRYDAAGQLVETIRYTTATDPAAAPSTDPTDVLANIRPANKDALHTYQYYDGAGRVVGEVDSQGFLTQTVYNEQSNQQQTLQYLTPVSVTSTADTLSTLIARAGSAETTTIQFDSFGRVATTTAIDGTQTSNEYDAAGRLVRQVQDVGASDQRAADTRYDAFGEVIGTLDGVGDALLYGTDSSPSLAELDAAITTHGMRYAYDSLGRRIRATNADLTDNSGSVIDPGSSTQYFYDSDGRLTHTVDATGAVSASVYNAFGEVIGTRRYKTLLSSDQVSSLTGGANDALVSLIKSAHLADDSHDQFTQEQYDQRGLMTSTTDALGLTTTNTYDAFGELHSQVRTILQGAGTTPAVTVETDYGYDLDGRLTSQTRDVGGVNFNTQTVYDAYGRVISSIDAAGQVTQTSYLDSGRTIQVTDPLGHTVRTEYDAFGRTLRQYDAVQMAQAAAGTPLAQLPATTYQYDDAHRRMVVTSPEGVQITTVKDFAGETLSVSVGTASGGTASTTSYTYNQDGQVTVVTDALGNPILRNDYDSRGRLKHSTDARNIVTQYDYDEVNRVVTRTVDPTTTSGSAPAIPHLNLVTQYAFNAFGQQVTVTEGAGTASARVTSYGYDQDGRLLQVVVDPDTAGHHGLNLATTYQYDGLDDTVQVSQGTVANPNQQVTQYVFDKLGRRVAEIDAPSSVLGAGPAGERDLTTQYKYDAAGNVSRTIDANGHSTWFVHDAAGQLTFTIDGRGDITQNYYDADGRLVQIRRHTSGVSVASLSDVVSASQMPGTAVDPRDQRTYFVYDNDGRQTFTIQAVTSDKWILSQRIYDAQGNVVEARRYDQFIPDSWVAASDPAGTGILESAVTTEIAAVYAALKTSTNPNPLAGVERTRYVFDPDNRLVYTVDAMGGVTQNVYDPAGNIVETVGYATQIALPALTADTLGQPEDLSQDTIGQAIDTSNVDNRTTHFSYDAAGRLRYTVQVLSAAQQFVTSRSYDALGELIETRQYVQALNNPSDYSEATLQPLLTPGTGDHRTEYTYDVAGREVYTAQLGSFTSRGEALFIVSRLSYDAMGNVVQSVAFNQPLKLTAFDQASVDSAVAAIATDPQNRTTSYVYDALGRQRFVVAADGSLSETVYDAVGQVTERRQFGLLVSPSTALTESALTQLRGASKVGDGITRGESYTYDAIGNVLTTTDANGQAEVSVYDAFSDKVHFIDKNGEALLKQHKNDNPPFDASQVTWVYVYDRLGRVYDTTTPTLLIQLSNQSTATSQALTTRVYRNALGNIFQSITALRTVDAATTTYTYDLCNRQTSITRPGAMLQLTGDTAPAWHMLQTQMVYNAFGDLKTQTEAFGTADARTTAYQYDTLGRQILMTLPGWYDPGQGKVVGGATPPAGAFARTLATTYDSFGNVTSTRLQTGLNSFQYEYKTYDQLGRVTYDVDALTQVTGFTYDSFGDQTVVTRYSEKIGLPANAATGAVWSTAGITTALGSDGSARTVTTIYDNMGRKTQVSQSAMSNYYVSNGGGTDANPLSVAGAAGVALTDYDYNVFGDLAHEAQQIDNVTDPPSDDGPSTDTRSGHWRDTYHYYDTLGRETLTVDAMDFQTARTYDANGNLTSVTEYAGFGGSPQSAAGTPGSIAANSNPGSVASTLPPSPPPATPQDRTSAYTYNALNERTSVQRKGLTYSTFFDGVYVDLTGDVTTQSLTYDSLGNVRTSTDALGNVTTMQYNLLGQLTQLTEPARLVAQPQTYNPYNTNSPPATDPFLNQISAAPVTTYILNAFGQVLQQVRDPRDGSGNTVTTSQTFDFVGDLISTTDGNGGVRNMRVDYAGRVIDQSQVINVTLNGGWIKNELPLTLTQTIERRFVYDALGEQTDVLDVYTDSSGNRLQTGTHQVYNAFGEVTMQYKVWGDANAAVSDMLASSTNNVLAASFSYDNEGQLVSQQDSNGQTVYFYDLAGDLTREEQRGNLAQGSPGVRVTETEYDALGRASLERAPSFSGMTPVILQETDRWGNVTLRDDFQLGTITSYQYNADNQVISENLPTSRAYRTDGSFYRASVTHETHYDLLGNVVEERDLVQNVDDLSQPQTLLRTRTKGYNQIGELTGETDATGVTTQYAYDANGNRVGTRNNRSTVFVDTFDANGNILSHSILRLNPGNDAVDGDPYLSGSSTGTPLAIILTRYQYDQANRRVDEYDTSDENADWTYSLYDERNLLTQTGNGVTLGVTQFAYDQFGNKTQAIDPIGNVQTWTYNASNQGGYKFGQLMTSTQTGPANGAQRTFTTTWSYNGFGQVTEESYTDSAGSFLSNDITFDYFENGLLKQEDDNTGIQEASEGGGFILRHRYLTTYSYTLDGQISEETFTQYIGTGNATPTSINEQRDQLMSYDEQGRLIKVQMPAAANTYQGQALANSLDTLTYFYDELGNKRAIITTAPNVPIKQQWFKYDAEGRVTLTNGQLSGGDVVISDTGTAISYDDLGRRQSTATFLGTFTFSGTQSSPNDPNGGIYDPNLARGDTWTQRETRQEQYTYNDLGYLRQIFDQVSLSNELFNTTDTNGTRITEQEGGKDSGFQLVLDQHTDLAGDVTLSTQYTAPASITTHGQITAAALNATTQSFYAVGGLRTQNVTYATDPSSNSQTTYQYDFAGNLTRYDYTSDYQDPFNKKTTTSFYTYGMELGGNKLLGISQTAPGGGKLPGFTNDTYDERGNLTSQFVVDAGAQNQQFVHSDTFTYDNNGQILTQNRTINPGDPSNLQTGNRSYFYVDGGEVAAIGTGTLVMNQVDNNFTPISAAYPANSPNSYTVVAGDTLAVIAQRVYGDAQLWYLIADANNLSFGPEGPLDAEVGKTYRIPKVVTNENNADTSTPYNPLAITGNSAPAPWIQPPSPSDSQCTGTGAVIASVVTTAVKVVISDVGGALLSIVLPAPVALGLAGAAGDAAGQLLGDALHIHKGFSFEEVAAAGLSAGIGDAAGLDPETLAGSTGESVIGQAIDEASSVVGLNDRTGPVSYTQLGTQTGFSALFGQGLVGSILAKIGTGALDPQSGWVFNSQGRNWTNIVSQSLDAATEVGLGGVLPKTPSSQSGSTQPPTPTTNGASQSPALTDNGAGQSGYNDPRLATQYDDFSDDGGVPSEVDNAPLIIQLASFPAGEAPTPPGTPPPPPTDSGTDSSTPDVAFPDEHTGAAVHPDYYRPPGQPDAPASQPAASEAATVADPVQIQQTITALSSSSADVAQQQEYFAELQQRADAAAKRERLLNGVSDVGKGAPDIAILQRLAQALPTLPLGQDRPVTIQDASSYSTIAGGTLDAAKAGLVEPAVKEILAAGQEAANALKYADGARPINARGSNAFKKTVQKVLETAEKDAAPFEKFIKGIDHVSHALSFISFTIDFTDRFVGDASPARTLPGKFVDGAASAGLNTAFSVAYGPIAAADALQSYVFGGFEPVPISSTIKGSTSSAVSVAESVFTGDYAALKIAHQRALAGDYGWIQKVAHQAGGWAATNGGGSERAWTVGSVLRDAGAPGVIERGAAAAASIPVLGHIGFYLGRAAGWYVSSLSDDSGVPAGDFIAPPLGE